MEPSNNSTQWTALRAAADAERWKRKLIMTNNDIAKLSFKLLAIYFVMHISAVQNSLKLLYRPL